MRCISCREEYDFKRLFMRKDGGFSGGFCDVCETRLFGRCFDEFTSEPVDICMFCDQPTSYFLIRVSVWNREASVSIPLPFNLFEVTHNLCVFHYTSLKNRGVGGSNVG